MIKENNIKRHYFDWAATAKPDCSFIKEVIPYGNPSSMHLEGRSASEALNSARLRCAASLGVPAENVYFTSGGTESNCIALYSHLVRKSSGRIIASEGEHSSVLANLRVMERLGKITGNIPIDSVGRVTTEALTKAVNKYNDVRYAAIMLVNNEIGSVNEIPVLQSILNENIHFHCDIVQGIGKIPVNLLQMKVNSASVSAHKLGGPRGIGLLYLKHPIETLYSGGGQEHNVRPGTENIAGAIALADCLEAHTLPEKISLEYEQASLRMRDLIEGLKKIKRCRIIPECRAINDERFSPYIVQAAIKDIPGEVLVRVLDDLGFAVSTGSACSSASPDRPVLAAMGIDSNTSLEGIRFSQGWTTTEEEIYLLLDAISEVLSFL